MTSTIAVASDVALLDRELNHLIQRGEILKAFELYYADNVTMQVNDEKATVGKAANRVRELEFLASIETVHQTKLLSEAVQDDVGFSEWELDATYRGSGRTVRHQVRVRRWAEGKVISEQLYCGAEKPLRQSCCCH